MGQSGDPLAADVRARAPVELRIRVLGAFHVELGMLVLDRSAFRLRSAAALLKLLALTPGHRLHRDHLADLLWPGVARPAAMRNLRYALHSARRTLDAHCPGAASLLARRVDQIALEAPGSVWVDALAFEAAVSDARRSGETGAYLAAVEAYAGDLLPEDRYEDWATGHRNRLRILLVAALTELAQLYEARGEAEAAIAVWRRSLALGSADGRQASADGPLTGAAAPTGPLRRHNTPHAATSFVGREREMVDLRRLLRGTRLLTLVGPGGIGKTRLALEVAAATRADHLDGEAVVELAALSAPALVPRAVASALGIREDPRRPLPAVLAEALKQKRLLLVLDNCEHLAPACAELAASLIHGSHRLRILATSRLALEAPGESVWAVPPLAEAVELFVQRAQTARPGLVPTDQEIRLIGRICARLDRLPLAIELAAARVKALRVSQIADRLDDRFRLLTDDSAVLPRHRTLHGAIDWSYGLLASDERSLLDRLSVLVGRFTTEDAEAVCGEQARTTLSHLVDRSLVVAERFGDATRYRLLETIRMFAEERLAERGETAAMRRGHATHFASLAEKAEPELRGPAQATWLERLEMHHDDLRAALRWAIGSEPETGLRLAAALWRFWHLRGYPAEGLDWLDAALAASAGASLTLRAKALNAAGILASERGDHERSLALHERCLALWRAIGDARGIAASLSELGDLATERGELAKARELYGEAMALVRGLGDAWTLAVMTSDFGDVAAREGDTGAAAALYEEALRSFRDLGDADRMAWTSLRLGDLARREGQHARARALYSTSLALFRGVGDRMGSVACLDRVALLAAAQGLTERAAQLFAAARAMREGAGSAPYPTLRADEDRVLAELRAGLGEAAFAAAWASGRALTLDQAVAYGVSGS